MELEERTSAVLSSRSVGTTKTTNNLRTELYRLLRNSLLYHVSLSMCEVFIAANHPETSGTVLNFLHLSRKQYCPVNVPKILPSSVFTSKKCRKAACMVIRGRQSAAFV